MASTPADGGALGLGLDRLLGLSLVPPAVIDAAGLDALRVPDETTVVLLSSGLDRATFGSEWDGRLSVHGGKDKVGLGTYAASVLFQVAPQAKVVSMNVYEGERVSRAGVAAGVRWAREHAADIDAVLLAFPPSEMLDPATAGLAAAGTVEDGARLAGGWAKLRDDLAVLGAAGVGVIAPAGDLGPAPQSVLGIAALPEVVAVGAAGDGGILPASSGGPSVFGRVKPDLVAPAGLPGLAPGGSALAGLAEAAGLDGHVPPLDLPIKTAGGRPTLIGSTIPAAAVVAAVTGQLHHDGVADGPTLRGLLNAAAVPLPGVPAWRQGAGLLQAAPRGSLAAARPLAGGSPDLGAEPPAGRAWAAEVPVLGGRLAGAAAVSFPSLVRTTGRAGREAVEMAGHPQPNPVVGGFDGGLRVSLPSGDNPWAPGAWCGYVTVPLSGITDVLEDLPACLVEGLHLTAFNFYLHDTPAENLTFALLPALPPGVGLLQAPLLVLPLDLLHEPLLAGVSGDDGLVEFANVPPAYFVMRQFSDYGSPVAEEFAAPTGGRPKVHARDLGETASYLNFDALVLPNPCPDSVRHHQPTGTACQRSWLEQHFAGAAIGYDKTTTRYLVDTPAGTIGVVFDFTKKSPGTAVTSRYTDLLAHDDLEYGSAVPEGRLAGSLLDSLGLELAPAWTFGSGGPAGDPEGTVATYRGLDVQNEPASLVGAATYGFALTTPNYRGTMRLNFGYRLEDAVLLVLVRVGEEVRMAAVTPQGSFELPPLGPAGPTPNDVAKQIRQALANAKADPEKLAPFGVSVGQASFSFDLKPHGNNQGTLAFLTVPLNPVRPAAVHLVERSFEITTWQRIDWPPAELARAGTPAPVPGHSFIFHSNYSATQMNHPDCRSVDNGEVAADVCENWQVLVHSPLDDAETFDVADLDGGGAGFLSEVAAAGGGLFNPHRGVHGERRPLAVGGIAPPLTLLGKGVVTNGRFWEQLVVPQAALAAHPGGVEVRLEDNRPGGKSALLRHADGPVPLAPYVAFQAWHRRLDASLTGELPKLPSAGLE